MLLMQLTAQLSDEIQCQRPILLRHALCDARRAAQAEMNESCVRSPALGGRQAGHGGGFRGRADTSDGPASPGCAQDPPARSGTASRTVGPTRRMPDRFCVIPIASAWPNCHSASLWRACDKRSMAAPAP